MTLSTFWKRYQKIILVVGGCMIALGIILYIVQTAGSWNFNRKENKLKANANLALKEIANTKEQIANLKQVEAAQIANVNHAVKEYQDSVNTTDADRIETDNALKELSNIHANSNISVEELERRLNGL